LFTTGPKESLNMSRKAVLAPTIRLALSTCMLATLVSTAGCKDDTETGSLTVEYQLGKASNTCESESVETVQAMLGDGEYEEDSPCDSDVMFTDIPSGTYSLLVQAIDNDGFAVMDNVDDEDTQQVEILGGSTREVEAQLAAAPARMYIRWALFLDDFQADCDEVTTKQFDVEVWDDADNMLLNDVIDCDAPTDEDRGGQYIRIPDPDRDIQGSAVVELDVQPQTAGGDAVGDPVVFVFDPPGRGRELSFTLTCEDDVCTGSGDPD
jgi:hypothetical protein